MQFKDQIDIKDRFLVLYFDAQMGPIQLSRILEVPGRTIRDWINRVKNGEDIREVKKGRGRKRSITPDIEAKVLRTARQSYAKTSTRRVGAKLDIGKSSVHRIFQQKRYRYQSLIDTPELTTQEKERRVSYCEEMVAGEGQAIDETFFSDETGIKLSESHPTRAWSRPGRKIEAKTPKRDVKVNCWAAISTRGATSLHIYEGSLTGLRYCDILQAGIPEMERLYPEGFYFQQDNHPAHKLNEEWQAENDLRPIHFPIYSPDLNPIENLWQP